MSEPPRSGRRRRPGWLSPIWLVPLLAALGTVVLVRKKLAERGPTIKISFADAEGLQAGKSVVVYRGVTMGTIEKLELDAHDRVTAEARLDGAAERLAREGARFWLVRPRLSPGELSGLGTIITGPFVAALPGEGPRRTEFTALSRAPLVPEGRSALAVVLIAPRIGSLNAGTPVFYRGVRVGVVERVDLADDARTVTARAVIEKPYGALVRRGSRFWNAGGLGLKFGLLKGVKLDAKSVSALMSGGIEFASPQPPGPAAADGQGFPLADEPSPDWLRWAPAFALPPRPAPAQPE